MTCGCLNIRSAICNYCRKDASTIRAILCHAQRPWMGKPGAPDYSIAVAFVVEFCMCKVQNKTVKNIGTMNFGKCAPCGSAAACGSAPCGGAAVRKPRTVRKRRTVRRRRSAESAHHAAAPQSTTWNMHRISPTNPIKQISLPSQCAKGIRATSPNLTPTTGFL